MLCPRCDKGYDECTCTNVEIFQHCKKVDLENEKTGEKDDLIHSDNSYYMGIQFLRARNSPDIRDSVEKEVKQCKSTRLIKTDIFESLFEQQ